MGKYAQKRYTGAATMTIPRLVTITFSHYCEKARWGLEHRRIEFTEEGHLPLLHVLPVKRAGGERQVPLLVTDGGPIDESTAILQWADAQPTDAPRLYPDALRDEVLRLEARYDRDLGPASRRWAYGFILREREYMMNLAETGAPRWERRTLNLLFPAARWLMRRGMRIDDAGVARSRDKLARVFDDVAERLADGRPYLTGERFTAADLTFAALGAPTVLPADYGAPFPAKDELPADAQAEITAYQAHPAGAFILRVYAEERGGRG